MHSGGSPLTPTSRSGSVEANGLEAPFLSVRGVDLHVTWAVAHGPSSWPHQLTGLGRGSGAGDGSLDLAPAAPRISAASGDDRDRHAGWSRRRSSTAILTTPAPRSDSSPLFAAVPYIGGVGVG